MRLIDADKLIEKLTNTINEWIEDMPDGEYLKGNVNFSVVARDMIREQPTAYDVDKVVEQLEKLKDIHFVRFDSYMKQGQKELAHKHLLKFNAYHKALEKVKAGGISD